MKELSIIIPAFNNYRLTAECLARIFKSDYPKEKYEIIFVNNASTDKTDMLISYLLEQDEPIKYIKLNENLNFLRGINRGWKEVETPFLMLLNNDVFLNSDCLSKMMEAIKPDTKIGIVGALEFLPDGTPTKEKPFMYWGKKNLLEMTFLGFDEAKIENNVVDVDCVGSACCIIRKEVSDKIGFFDELFVPCMCEQEDYWMRTKLAGYRIVMATQAKMTHIVGATTKFHVEYYQNIIKVNKEKFINKWKYLIEGGKKL